MRDDRVSSERAERGVGGDVFKVGVENESTHLVVAHRIDHQWHLICVHILLKHV